MLLLGREPESEAVIDEKLESAANLCELIDNITCSEEFDKNNPDVTLECEQGKGDAKDIKPNLRFYLEQAVQKNDPGHQGKIPRKPFISAYYYLWYFTPEGIRSRKKSSGKWAEGYARALLCPPQYPSLGEYVSNDPEVIEAHIDWAADHGIDCFICNWEGMQGHRRFVSENLVHILQGEPEGPSWSEGKCPFSELDLNGRGWDSVSMGWDRTGYPIRNLTRIRFSVLIESRLIVETWPPAADSRECLEAFGTAVRYMAQNFFCSPQWQRIDDRPVLYIYEVYSWKGTQDAFKRFRDHLDDVVKGIYDPILGRCYEGLFVIADVVYPVTQDLDRFNVFDGVTGYQPYPPVSSEMADAGKPSWVFRGSGLFRCEAFEGYHKKFMEWGEINDIPLIPTVIPRYNDQGVRGVWDNYVYPPISAFPYTDIDDARKGVLFRDNLDAQLRWVDPELNMLNINSWNEWFEDTTIEPVGYIPEMGLPDYLGQGDNTMSSTRKGVDRSVPEKVVIYSHDGHRWIDTPEKIRKEGIDVAKGFEWPCYGFDYLRALAKHFGLHCK